MNTFLYFGWWVPDCQSVTNGCTDFQTYQFHMRLHVSPNSLILLMLLSLWREIRSPCLDCFFNYGWGCTVSLVTYGFKSPCGKSPLRRLIGNPYWFLSWNKRQTTVPWKLGFLKICSLFYFISFYEWHRKGAWFTVKIPVFNPLMFVN